MSLIRRNPKRDDNEASIVAHLERAGCIVHKVNGVGLPDLLVTHPNGRYFVVEVKGERGKLTEGQRAFFKDARARNAPAFVCRDHDDVRLALAQVGA